MVSDISTPVDVGTSVIGKDKKLGNDTDRFGEDGSSTSISRPASLRELSLQELLEIRCYFCEVCDKRFWLDCQSHICDDGLRVIHSAPRGVQFVAERYDPNSDGDAGVLTRSDVYRGSYHRPNDSRSDIPACFTESSEEWSLVSRRRAQVIGRVPCSVCVCEDESPSRRALLMEAREFEEAHPRVVKR